MTLSTTTVPPTYPYSVDGNGKHKGPTALALKRAMSRLGYLPWEPSVWDQAFNQKLEGALDKWDAGKDGYGEGRYNKIRAAVIPAGLSHAGQYALDSVAIGLIADEHAASSPSVPNLGPLYSGGKPVLDQDLTHATSGIALYPAFDDAFSQGRALIAPERITVTRDSSANPGDAFYADGASGLRYWFGHLTSAPAVGKVFEKGAQFGTVAANSVGGGPHVHCAVNCEKLYGSGKQFVHKTTYEHGAPTIRAQMSDGGP